MKATVAAVRLLGLIGERRRPGVIQELMQRKYRPGDWVVFRKPKRGTAPGPRAQHVNPTRFGEEYVYEVDKYWVVEQVDDGQLIVRTRRGKRHAISPQDHRLRHARWWERWMLRDRFPDRDQPSDESLSEISGAT